MTELITTTCPCGAIFDVAAEFAKVDEDGNARCDNCQVELGMKEDLAVEPSDDPVPAVAEGIDADAVERAQVIKEVTGKVDLRTKEGRALKEAGLA